MQWRFPKNKNVQKEELILDREAPAQAPIFRFVDLSGREPVHEMGLHTHTHRMLPYNWVIWRSNGQLLHAPCPLLCSFILMMLLLLISSSSFLGAFVAEFVAECFCLAASQFSIFRKKTCTFFIFFLLSTTRTWKEAQKRDRIIWSFVVLYPFYRVIRKMCVRVYL